MRRLFTRKKTAAQVRCGYRPTFEPLEDRLAPATLPPGFTETIVATGISNPTAMEFAPDGRLFVAEQGGRLRVIKNGTLLSRPFVSLNVDSAGERGLLGVAFDPNFFVNHFVYVYYTALTPAVHNRVSRFTASGDVAVGGSETIILELNNLSGATNHNGGAIHFGADGKLYIGVGENANGANSQSLNNLLGKLLRINSNGSIPTDNPFFNTATGNNRAIWALGLRNPFTFGIRPGTGRIFINDVGQDTWEEINDGIAGSNYGWPTTEGPTDNPNFRSPIFAYQHGESNTEGCAIVGGAFYNPETRQFPTDHTGDYFFADLCNGWIRRYDVASDTASTFATGISVPVDLRVSADGSLYYLARGGGGMVGRIQFKFARFVTAIYRDLLNRAPDPAGLDSWAEKLNNGTPRAQVIDAIWRSAEHRRLQVNEYFQEFFNREPDTDGRTYWVNQFRAGKSERDVVIGMLTSPEYRTAHASSSSFVDGLYLDILQRPADEEGKSLWVQRLNSGRPRSEVANAFMTSAEKHRLIVDCFFNEYLDREPDAEGEDSALDRLRAGESPASVAFSTLGSPEYFDAALNGGATYGGQCI